MSQGSLYTHIPNLTPQTNQYDIGTTYGRANNSYFLIFLHMWVNPIVIQTPVQLQRASRHVAPGPLIVYGNVSWIPMSVVYPGIRVDKQQKNDVSSASVAGYHVMSTVSTEYIGNST